MTLRRPLGAEARRDVRALLAWALRELEHAPSDDPRVRGIQIVSQRVMVPG